MIHPYAHGHIFWDGGEAPPVQPPLYNQGDQKLRYILRFGPRIIILFTLLGL